MSGKRVRLAPGERRQQLLDLGIRMLSERGLEQVSVEEIADQAGISRGLLFHYFPSKRDFHLAVVRHASDGLLRAIRPDQALSLGPMLYDAMRRYVDYVVENQQAYISQLRGPASADPDFVEIFDGNRAAIAGLIFTHAPVPGEIDRTVLELAVRGWIAFIEETTISWVRAQHISRDQLVELNVRALAALVLGSEGAAELFSEQLPAPILPSQ